MAWPTRKKQSMDRKAEDATRKNERIARAMRRIRPNGNSRGNPATVAPAAAAANDDGAIYDDAVDDDNDTIGDDYDTVDDD